MFLNNTASQSQATGAVGLNSTSITIAYRRMGIFALTLKRPLTRLDITGVYSKKSVSKVCGHYIYHIITACRKLHAM